MTNANIWAVTMSYGTQTSTSQHSNRVDADIIAGGLIASWIDAGATRITRDCEYNERGSITPLVCDGEEILISVALTKNVPRESEPCPECNAARLNDEEPIELPWDLAVCAACGLDFETWEDWQDRHDDSTDNEFLVFHDDCCPKCNEVVHG
jgi:hypothetical protein